MNTFFIGGVWQQGNFGLGSVRASALVILSLVLLANPLWAQRYKVIEPRLTPRQAKSIQGAVGQAIRNPEGFGANASTVTDYFTKFYFPKMTHADPDSLAKLGDMRENLFRRYIRATPNPESQTALTNLALKAARHISQGNYHPAVRYNATLILGNLDQQIAGGRQNPTPPIPLPAATTEMLGLLEQQDIKGLKVHPSVQLGALIGLERHARFGIASELAERVTKVALDAIAQENPDEEVSKDVHRWMKSRAASVLVYQHQAKPNANIQATLDTLMADEKFKLENRCFVAGLMKRLKYAQAEDVKRQQTVVALGGLSRDVLKAEAKLAREYQQEILGGGNFGRRNMFGGRGGGGDDQPKYERRQLLSRLRAIYNGGGSLAEGSPDDAKIQLQGLLDAMKPVRIAAADKDSTDLEIAKAVIQAAQDVDQVIRSWNQGAAPAEEPEADFSEEA